MSTCSPVMVAAVAVPPCGQSVHAPSGCSRLAQLVAGEHRAAGRLRRPPSAPPGSCTSPPRPKRSRPWEARASSPKKRRFPCRAVRMQRTIQAMLRLTWSHGAPMRDAPAPTRRKLARSSPASGSRSSGPQKVSATSTPAEITSARSLTPSTGSSPRHVAPGAGRAGHRPRLGATPVRTPCRSMTADAIRNPPASRSSPTAAAPRTRAAPACRSRRSAARCPDRTAPRSPPPA